MFEDFLNSLTIFSSEQFVDCERVKNMTLEIYTKRILKIKIKYTELNE